MDDGTKETAMSIMKQQFACAVRQQTISASVPAQGVDLELAVDISTLRGLRGAPRTQHTSFICERDSFSFARLTFHGLAHARFVLSAIDQRFPNHIWA